MPSYKLYYFDIRGLAELPRLMFTVSGTAFENVRVPREEWAALKPSMPFGQMPVLEVDGKKYGQSIAIVAYLMDVLNLGGKTPLDKMMTFQVIGLMQDVRSSYMKIHFEQDEDKKKEGMEKMQKEEVPKVLGYLEKMLTDSGTGFYVGNSITAADLAVYELFEGSLKHMPDLFTVCNVPKVAENRKKVAADSKIAAYLKTRPDTEY